MINLAIISHYKSVSEARLSLGKENVIVGPNGVGKSNIVDALYFLRDAAREDLDYAVTKRHGIESVRQWSRTRPYNIGLELQFSSKSGSGSYKVSISSAKGNFRVEEEYGDWTGKVELFGDDEVYSRNFSRASEGRVKISSNFDRVNFPDEFPVSPSELFISQISNKSASIASIFFNDLAEEITSFAAYAIYPNTIRTPQSVSNEDMLSDSGSNLASIIKRMTSHSKRKNRESLVESLRAVLPIIDNIEIRSAGGFYVPVFRVREPNGDLHDLNMSQISDGTLRMLGLLSAFYQPNAPLKIALEEPEQMIHPGLLPVLVDAARDYSSSSERDNQLFLTTHSPNLLDLFDADNIIRAQFKDGVTVCGPVLERQKDLIRRSLFSAGEIMIAEGFFDQ